MNKHFNELGFSEAAKNVLFRNPNIHHTQNGEMCDWMHINSMSVLGPNKWYDAGDERFAPDNIIWDGRETNIIAIIDRKTGKLVWKLGPDYATGKAKEIGQIVGQHHAHMIPKGLPGEGNILIYDNGGWAGYGAPNPAAPAIKMPPAIFLVSLRLTREKWKLYGSADRWIWDICSPLSPTISIAAISAAHSACQTATR